MGQLGLVSGLTEESCQEITLAVDEALANIIRHAYKNRHDQEIEFNCKADDDRPGIHHCSTRGEAPDPARICGQPLDEVSLSGRGTHLMRAAMDEMKYERVPKGNQLTLIKRLPAAKMSADGT